MFFAYWMLPAGLGVCNIRIGMVAIISEPAKRKAAPLQLLVELVEDDVAEQGT
jgi:hypothetical protein